MKYGSLFTGIGGIDLGLDRAGMECVWQVEMDDYANRVLEKHWPNIHREKDVKNVGSHNLEYVDLIAAGWPCQDISNAGQKQGIQGKRSGLFTEVIRVAYELRPAYLLLENVSALLDRGLDRVLGEMAEVGFNAEWHCIQASSFNAPHIRERIFILGYTDSKSQSVSTEYAQDTSGVPKVVDHIERNEDGYFCTKCQCGIFAGCECNIGEWECRDCGEYTYPFFYEFNEGCQNCSSQNVRYAFGDRSSPGVARSLKRGQGGPRVVIDSSDVRGWKEARRKVEWWETEPGIRRVADGITNREN